jgi:ribosome-associated protein
MKNKILNLIAQTIYDKKGINILALDVQGISTLTDYVIIAEGNVDRHVTAIAEAILAALKENGHTPSHVEGLQEGDWVVLDFLDFMVHLFMPGLRDKYRLEELWKKGHICDLVINTTPSNKGSYSVLK